MNQEIRHLAIKQYFKYFVGWFIIAFLCVSITIGFGVVRMVGTFLLPTVSNSAAESERVFDYADVLTDEEEEKLRKYIAKKEAEGEIHIVIVTADEPMGISDKKWENNMMRYADDFYDNGNFGWNKPHGDGVCFLDNFYEDSEGSQKGAWLSTSGKMEATIGYQEEGVVLDAWGKYIDRDPYKAYCEVVDQLAYYGEYGFRGQIVSAPVGIFFAFVAAVFVAIVFAVTNLAQNKAVDTTVPDTYVEDGRIHILNKADDFVRKSVSSVRISSSSGSGGGGHRGGGSHGSHRSSGGHSHGGGGRRR